MSLHSKFSPSRLYRIITCPGSVSLCNQVEEQKQSKYAAEGSMLHLAIERALDTLGFDDKVPFDIIKPDLDKEQRNTVQDAFDYAVALQRKRALQSPRVIMQLEEKVTLERFGAEDVYGTLDLSLVSGRILDILDWKFGKGVEVFAEDNDQLYAYALGKVGDPLNLHDYDEIHIHIVQPRIYNYDVIIVKPADLNRWYQHRLLPALDSTQQKKPPFCAGEKQCRWCDAKNTCEHRHQFVQNQAGEIFKVHAKLPDQVDNTEVAKLIANAKMIRNYLDDIELYALNQLKIGKDIPGFKMVAGRSSRAWVDQKSALKYLDEGLGVPFDDCFTEPKFVSPAQAEKVIGRKASQEDLFQALYKKFEGKPTLAVETDRRPALPLSAERSFAEFAK